MNVLIVSQCSKNALKETRRVVDQFAERKGERVWQTEITKQGLDTLYKMLRRSARRNTSVACHWLKGRNRSEILWFVGDISRFTSTGTVPTNSTEKDILRSADENDWATGEQIRVLSALGALFHDFGKANNDFQKCLAQKGNTVNIIRHEWISVLILEAMASGKTDGEWLHELESGKWDGESIRSAALEKLWEKEHAPLKNLPPIARFVGWLVLSHHRLPTPDPEERGNIDGYINYPFNHANVRWNHFRDDNDQKRRKALELLQKLPTESEEWQKRAAKAARAVLRIIDLEQVEKCPPENNHYISAYCRLTLMMADHIYSGIGEPHKRETFDKSDKVLANKTGDPPQRLDEHIIGVEKMCHRILFELMGVDNAFSRIARHKLFRKNTREKRFMWQNDAFALAESVREDSRERGFFGINMASTGCGKTIANGRIMYGLADQERGARFTIALGLRVLTLQTGQAYREMMNLDETDLGILVGGQAYRDLYEENENFKGSESAEDLMPENSYVHYEGALDTGVLAEWLSGRRGAVKLLSSPVLTCTIDHLIPASEGIRGGQQIAPMLRLMTSDLVLDEPDDFDVGDLYALSRLVYFAGLAGSRVLLSSATITPSIAEALYRAYSRGRIEFNRNRGRCCAPVCAWFDEYGCTSDRPSGVKSFIEKHGDFAKRRIERLKNEVVRRRGVLIPYEPGDNKDNSGEAETRLAELVGEQSVKFHNEHHTVTAEGKRMSFGLVRMANIRNLVKTVLSFASLEPPEGVCFHFCCYHSRYPMIMRSNIEFVLDEILNRKKEFSPESNEFLAEALKKDGIDHIFIVFASPVAEVGRDHDYDWGIVEPSSMRSIIQLAGRIMRHREVKCETPNLGILRKNIRGKFSMPGFERYGFKINSHDLSEALEPEQYEVISSIPRLLERDVEDRCDNLSDFEHYVLRSHLIESSKVRPAKSFWATKAYLTGVIQSNTRFRKGSPETGYFLQIDEDGETCFCVTPYSLDEMSQADSDSTAKRDSSFNRVDLETPERSSTFINLDYTDLLGRIADEKNLSLEEASLRYGTFGVRESARALHFNERLGIWDD
ncbi:type I-F CRISPR-associated helicase Cas3f [Limisalsivibrio acetivorans]|uniref:type I-F CRISPR-associated helicase Cas3f n=1 Tax=Limisalsivibrio acetivorans TaxID=1304888 RepID=UPI0003B32BEC|nr:type I-F CRISPR-associated helicase Cas3f [Limisalsivibrio acetivorans]